MLLPTTHCTKKALEQPNVSFQILLCKDVFFVFTDYTRYKKALHQHQNGLYNVLQQKQGKNNRVS